MIRMPARSALRGAFRSSTLVAALAALLASGATAQDAIVDPALVALAEEQGAANAEAGPRHVPSRDIPVPGTVSSEVQAMIAAPYSTLWDAVDTTPEEWRAFEAPSAGPTESRLANFRDEFSITIEEATIGGVPSMILTPQASSKPMRARQS